MEISVPISRKNGFFALTAALVLGSLTRDGRAADLLPESCGLRYGLPSSGASLDFHQGEAFADWNLPWKWDLGADWVVQTRLDVAAGWFGEGDVGGGIFSAGPLLVLSQGHFPLSLQGGVSPTGITRTQFNDKDFGEPFQFASSIGLYWDFASHFRLGSRFQHMSNAGLSRHNPGINMVMFSLGYVF
jgi:hypothetical protein